MKMNLITPYQNGIYKTLFYGHCLELENGDKLETEIGVRCPRNACGGWKTYKIENNVVKEIEENFSEKLSDVKPKTKLPEGTFTNKAATIKKILVEHSKNKNDCVKKINFYINRAGKNLKNKTEIMKAKKMIENMIEFSNLTERLKNITFARQVGNLYYTASSNNALKILRSNKIFQDKNGVDDFGRKYTSKFICTSRDKHQDFVNYSDLVSVQFVLDGDKLSDKYKITTIDELKDRQSYRNVSETRILTDEIPLRPYLKEINIYFSKSYDQELQEMYAYLINNLTKVIRYCEENNIKYSWMLTKHGDESKEDKDAYFISKDKDNEYFDIINYLINKAIKQARYYKDKKTRVNN